MLIAVALASGRWKSDTRKSIVAIESTTARIATQPRAISRIRRVAPVAFATASTSSVAMTPRTKMSCAAGIVSLAYLTSESLTMKQADRADHREDADAIGARVRVGRQSWPW